MKIKIVRVEQFAEVAVPHQKGRNRLGSLVREIVSGKFVAPVPEHLVFVGVEMAGNIERPANVVSEIVVMIGRNKIRGGQTGGGGVGVPLPGVGVQEGVTNVFVSGAVELGSTALGDDADLAAGRSAVLRSIVCAQDLDLFGGILVSGAQTGAVGACARGDCAIDGDHVVPITRAVEVRRSLAKIEI